MLKISSPPRNIINHPLFNQRPMLISLAQSWILLHTHVNHYYIILHNCVCACDHWVLVKYICISYVMTAFSMIVYIKWRLKVKQEDNIKMYLQYEGYIWYNNFFFLGGGGLSAPNPSKKWLLKIIFPLRRTPDFFFGGGDFLRPHPRSLMVAP